MHVSLTQRLSYSGISNHVPFLYYRDLLYLTCRQQLKELKFDFTYLDTKVLAKLFALIAQVEHGEYNPDRLPNYSSFFPCETWSPDFEQLIESTHLSLERKTADQARIEVLHILSDRLEYGVESFHVTSATAKNTSLILVCRHDGLRIYRKEQGKETKMQKKNGEDRDSEVVFKEVSERKCLGKTQCQLLLQL